MKKILSLILAAISVTFAGADDSSWKMHPIFDETITHIIPTPNYVYFTSRHMALNPTNEVFSSLFRYDRKGDELLALSTSNFLNGNSVRDVAYNPEKGYIFVLYKDYDIDLIYNDSKVVNIPYYKMADITYPKNVNSITFDPENDRVYLATNFGYIALNDKKYEIAQSRVYGQPLLSFARMGNDYLAIFDNKIMKAAANSPHLSLDQWETVKPMETGFQLYPLGNEACVLVTDDNGIKGIKKISKGETGYEFSDILDNAYFYNTEYNSKGVAFTLANAILTVDKNGETSRLERPSGFQNTMAATDNYTEIWNGTRRKGINSIKKSGDNWSLTRDWMAPNAPATYATISFINHPEFGLLMLDYGYLPQTYTLNSNSNLQLSGYKQGRWTNFAPAYTNTDRTSIITASNGMAIDPDNNSYIYITSYHNGIMRLNLKNPQDIIHLSRETDPDNGKSGFAVLEGIPNKNSEYANISAPYFDKQGNLWMCYADWDDEANPNPHFFCWLKEDRKALSPTNIIQPKVIEFDDYFTVSNQSQALPLLKTGNGLIVYASGLYDEELGLINTNGTPHVTSDDKVYKFPTFTDGDGGNIEIRNINFIWEDPSSGYVWICHQNGVCYFVPSQVTQGVYQLNRVKVPRNDGTNLADYLLEGVKVNHIATDSEGRKWFSTAGAGIVCTSSDGREILEEFTTENSPLPDDGVYAIGYNTANNSLMISTTQGYTEYSLPVSQASSTKEDIKAFPNPVRPEYSGYVTITDIPTGSFVKIADSAGNLVKDLGVMSGFEMLWDISDSNFNRVKSGVYHILISPSNETSSYSTVGKILVMN